MVIRDPPPEYNGPKVLLFADFLAPIIEAPGQTQSPVIRMNEHLYAIEGVPMRVMSIESVITGDLLIGMVIAEATVADDDRQGTAHHLPIDLDDQLAFRK